MPELEPGGRAPSFTVKDHDGRTVSLKDLLGTRTVLYVFTKADTSG